MGLPVERVAHQVDHKRIGVMYIVLALVMLLRGFADAIMMRSQQALAFGGNPGLSAAASLRPDLHGARRDHDLLHGDAVHGHGLMNFVVPLQIGARDVAFPFLNSLSFWLTRRRAAGQRVAGVGEFARTGWLAYPPLSELQFSPGVGVDYYIWALQISGVGTLLSGINFS
jgi:cytochrome o ubiquinol oxidase subunit 1